jgi:hypothetical protein
MPAWRVLLSATSGQERHELARLKAATSPPFNDVMKRTYRDLCDTKDRVRRQSGNAPETCILEVLGSKLQATMTARCNA